MLAMTSRAHTWGVALLAALAADAFAETAVVTFDPGTIPPGVQCNETWFEDGIGLRLVPSPVDPCGLSLCMFAHLDSTLGLGPAQLRADLSSVPGPVDRIDVTLGSVCIDCVTISVFDGNDLVATTTNGPITFPPATVALDVGGVPVDRLEVNPCFELILDQIVVHFEPGQTSVVDGGVVPESPHVALGVLRPNPFTASTSVPLVIGAPGHLDLGIYSYSGRRVRKLVDARVSAGRQQVAWDGLDDRGRVLASGAYLVQLRFDGVVVSTRKVVLLR